MPAQSCISLTISQGMIGLGRISMRISKGLGASLALSEEDGLLLPTLVMFRDGKFMRSTHIAPTHNRDSLRFLVAKTYEFVYRYLLCCIMRCLKSTTLSLAIHTPHPMLLPATCLNLPAIALPRTSPMPTNSTQLHPPPHTASTSSRATQSCEVVQLSLHYFCC